MSRAHLHRETVGAARPDRAAPTQQGQIGNIVERAVVRLVGALLLEQSDEWATQRSRTITLETIGAVSDTASVSLPAEEHRSYTSPRGTIPCLMLFRMPRDW